MARKPITYARKRHRNNGKPAVKMGTRESSPTIAPLNPGEEIVICEMERRMLKRSRQTWDANATGQTKNIEHLSKRHKSNGHHARESLQAVISPIDQQGLRLQTPQNTSLAREQVFELESSRGRAQSEEYELSPVPPALSLVSSNEQSLPAHDVGRKRLFLHKTSSSNLKENVLPSRSSSKSRPSSANSSTYSKRIEKFKPKLYTRGPLASPFASKPSSPQPSSKLRSSQDESLQGSKTSIKRTLSDTHFNPNIPSHRIHVLAHVHSTNTSPTPRQEDELIKTRRPSAPSATSQRPDINAWFSPYSSSTNLRDQILSSSADFFVSGSRNRDLVDFNRPPSQLSCNFEYDEAFFSDALEISTPFKPKGQRSSELAYSDSRTLHFSDMHITRPLSLDPEIFGSWVSDSLISSPTLSHESTYSHNQEGVDAVLDLDCKSAKPISLLPPSGAKLPSPLSVERSESLQDLFDKLDLKSDDGNSAHPMRNLRLDLETGQSSDGQPLQSPAQISPSQIKHAPVESKSTRRTGRDRRGTIRASDCSVVRSPILAGPRRTRSGTVVQGSTRPRRERSDTIVARPSNLASSKYAHTASTCVRDIDMSDSSGDVGRQADVLTSSEEKDDELLLKNHWIDEEWVVAAPPSPVLPRKRKVITEWKRRLEEKKVMGVWGMDHDPDDGEDDPLLLK